jgi:hypothetical protein
MRRLVEENMKKDPEELGRAHVELIMLIWDVARWWTPVKIGMKFRFGMWRGHFMTN